MAKQHLLESDEVRLVVIDDDVDAAFVLSEMLRGEGYSVRACHDAEQALILIAEFDPVGVLLDLGLPDRDGLDLARHLRQAYDASLVLVAVTGRTGERDNAAAMAAGIDFVIVKPVDLKRLKSIFPSVC